MKFIKTLETDPEVGYSVTPEAWEQARLDEVDPETDEELRKRIAREGWTNE
jgi:hypothetical protein|tara:strand:- start:1726 stop:1878 length:153 start_codon:yes stop_codon:yes gene_type:complete